ncbi:IS66 family insertion sequence element accessory protein TnpB [Sulfitobacter litoralis]|uniref:IS66 family insertion sequence element accessory protein TnpB n=1 Tax=Sulfitobacter litoralis TaxID=335975 RepID=UPI001428C56C
MIAYKRLEDNSFKWPAIKNGLMRLEPAQFEALFAGRDWRRVQPLEGGSALCGGVTHVAVYAGHYTLVLLWKRAGVPLMNCPMI